MMIHLTIISMSFEAYSYLKLMVKKEKENISVWACGPNCNNFVALHHLARSLNSSCYLGPALISIFDIMEKVWALGIAFFQ